MKSYPAYKDSVIVWIWEIPEAWEFKRLKYVTWINPARKTDIAEDQNCVFIPMEAMRTDGGFDNSKF